MLYPNLAGQFGSITLKAKGNYVAAQQGNPLWTRRTSPPPRRILCIWILPAGDGFPCWAASVESDGG